MRMLVTGAAGAVGSYVADVFPEWDIVATDIVGDFEHVDVADPEAVAGAVARFQPDLVLHLAAATDVDACEQDPDWAYGVNAIGTQNVTLACKKTGAMLVYISTAGVFGGDKPEPYTEFDEPAPANVYGLSKLAGERIVASMLDRYFIARAGWMVGGGPHDKKFVGKIIQLIEQGTEHLRAVDDKFGSPTYAPDMLAGIKRLMATGYYGLYHVVNEGSCSRYEVAVAMCQLLGRDDITVEPVSSAYFPLPAPRARSEAMRNYKADLLGLESLRPWRDALAHYLRNELAPAATRERTASA